MDAYSDIGTWESDEATNIGIRKYFAKQKGEDISMLERAASVALRPFSVIQFCAGRPTERVSVKELKLRFKEIRETGYGVKPYSKMKRDELRGYLGEIRVDLRKKKEEYGL